MNYSTKDSAKIIKKALKKEYKKVSVICARGTACGWIDARVTVERPANCHCILSDRNWKGEPCDEHRTSTYCKACSKKSREEEDKAEKIAYKAMKENKMEFDTYMSDDYSDQTDHSKFNLQVAVL